jgi:sodium/potassium-transporting ATPase subunit alpha
MTTEREREPPGSTPPAAVDIEAGSPPAETPKAAAMAIEEPYLEIAEIANRNPESGIHVSDIEKSTGLSSKEASTRLQLYGRNVLTPPPKMPEWKRFLLQFTNLFMVLLNTCGLLSVIAFALQSDKGDKTNLYLAIVLFAVVFMTCYLQFHEEGKAYKIMDSFSKMLAVSCTVIRDGKQQEVPVGDLVLGDLVLVKDGNKVPADLVLLLCRGLKTECSSLTGESEPISCSDHASKPETRIFECKNLAFSSSLCFDGMAIGLVVRTGDNTVSTPDGLTGYLGVCGNRLH